MHGFIPPLPRFLLRRGSQLSTRTLTPIRACFPKSVLGRKTGYDETGSTSLNVHPQRHNFIEIRHVIRERKRG